MTESDFPQPANMTLQATVQQGPAHGSGDQGRRSDRSLADRFSWPGRIAVLLAVVLTPWAFGGYAFWVQQWIAIAFLVGLGFWWFETAMNERSSQVFPYLFFPVTAGLFLALLQLIGLPEAVAESVLGRQIEILEKYTESTVSPSVSLNHDGTWHQIRLLVIAIAGLLLGCRYFRSKRDMALLLSTLTLNGVALSLFGIVHRLSGDERLYWVYELVEGGTPFGPYVNRNNASGYLLICLACAIGLLPIVMSKRKQSGPPNMVSKELPFWRQINYHIADFMAELTTLKLSVVVAIIIITAAIVATLSRGGVLAMLVGGSITIMFYGMARQPKNSTFIFVPLIAMLALLTGWIGFGEQLQQRFDRIDYANLSESDSRMEHWQTTWPAVEDFGLLGSGLGTYKGVHRLYSKNENVVFHYAENQYFQSLVEAGWPGLILFLSAWILAYLCSRLLLNRGVSASTIGVGTAATFLIFSQATASFFDFGLYMPANMLALAVLIGFVSYHAQALGSRLKDRSWLRFQLPNYAVQVAVLTLFAAMVLVAVDVYGLSKIESLTVPRSSKFTSESPSREETDQKLRELMPLVIEKPTAAGLAYAGELWIHMCQMEMQQQLLEMPATKLKMATLDADEQKVYLESLWRLGHLQRLHENLVSLSEQSRYAYVSFRNQPAIKENLPFAQQLLRLSRDRAPLDPIVHLHLAEVEAVISPPGVADRSMEQAIDLAPSNAKFRLVAGIYYLQAGSPEQAAPHIKRYLELQPQRFRGVLELLTGRTNRSFPAVDADLVLREMLPEDGRMLFIAAMEFYESDPQKQSEILKRAVEVVKQQPHWTQEDVVLQGDIQNALGQYRQALEHYDQAVRSRPLDDKTRFKRARLRMEVGDLEAALEDAEYLSQRSNVAAYDQFRIQVQRKIARRGLE